MRRRAAASLWLLLAGAAPAAGAQTVGAEPVSRQAAPGDSAVIQPGDLVRITVWRNTELSGEIVVAPDGSLQHPLYREVRIGGLTRSDAEARVREVLLRYENAPQFVVEPLARVSVMGEVRSPNLYSMQLATTVAQAVALAGGTTDRSSGKAVLVREGRRQKIDLRRAEKGAAAVVVQSRDEIIVERSRRGVFGSTLGLVAGVAATIASVIIALRSGG